MKQPGRPWNGTVLARNGFLYIQFKDPTGRWRQRGTGLADSATNRDQARGLLAEMVASWKPRAPGAAGGRGLARSFKRRRGHACEVCGWVPRPPLRLSAVNAHHIRPRCEGGPHSDENRVVLCPNHHAVADALHRERPSAGRDDLLARIRAWDAAAPA